MRTPDGTVWSRWGTGSHTWLPLLTVFDQILLVARIQDVPEPPPGSTPVSHDRVRICPVTYFQGPREYAQRYTAVRRDLSRWLSGPAPVILRMPSPLGNAIHRSLIARRSRFAVEVAGDPYDQMSPGAMRHPLRPFFRSYYTAIQAKVTRYAQVVRYVTRSALQRRYPAGESAAVHSVSDVFLPPEAYLRARRPKSDGGLRLVFVGMLEQLYKGPDVLLEAVAQVKRGGMNCSLSIAGDGKFRPMLEGMAQSLGIRGCIEFLGACGRERIQRALDDSDLFVLPSRQEGLPRAMLEAMARSLPCIGTDVGGIPELLERDWLVAPNQVAPLAAKLLALDNHRDQLAKAGERNYIAAQQYRLSVRYRREASFARDVRRLCV